VLDELCCGNRLWVVGGGCGAGWWVVVAVLDANIWLLGAECWCLILKIGNWMQSARFKLETGSECWVLGCWVSGTSTCLP
jgi:hypothetical protein